MSNSHSAHKRQPQSTVLASNPTVFAGDIFGRLTVIGVTFRIKARPDSRAYANVVCECSCGTVVAVQVSSMKSGLTKSCGCLSLENSATTNRTHGMTATSEYYTWGAMIARCSNPNCKDYSRYGGRGIVVCERWHEFASFYADMGPRPSPSHEIDRIDNDGNYEPGNCRWATKSQQMNNRTTSLYLTIDGETATANEWSKRSGVPYHTIYNRLSRGVPAREAVYGVV